MNLGDMTANEVVHAVDAPEIADPRQRQAARTIARLAAIPTGASAEEARDLLDAWFWSEAASDVTLADVAAELQMLARPIHAGTFGFARDMKVPLVALALCSDATGNVASVDIGQPPQEHRQITVVPEDGGYRVMVPLSADVYYDGWRLLIRQGILPQAILLGSVGHPATALVDHPLVAAGGRIAEVGEPQGTFDTLMLEEPSLTAWSIVA